MNFLSLTSLLLFGLALPIVLLYILKLRRRREPVSTLMFWEQLFREKQTTSLFQKLKHLLSLLFQLLFLALLALSGTLGARDRPTAVCIYYQSRPAYHLDYRPFGKHECS